MKKHYFQHITVAFLLLVTQFLFAQEKPLPDPVSMQSGTRSWEKAQPASNEQYSFKKSMELPPSMIYPVPELSSLPEVRLKSQTLNGNAGEGIAAGLTFDCEGTPVGLEDVYTVEDGKTLTVAAPGLLTNDIDPDGDLIVVSNFFPPANGSLTSIVTNGSFIYVPDAGFTGTDQFTYILRDANNNFSEPVTVTIEVVESFDRKPIGIADNYATAEGTALAIAAPGLMVNDLHPDGEGFLVSTFTQTTHGTLTSVVTSGAFTYVPDAGFTGTDEFTYILRELGSDVFSDPVTVTIEVFGDFNRKPVGVSDHYGTTTETPLVVVAPGLGANDFDPDGDDFLVSTFTQPAHGTLTSVVTSGAFTYVPDAGFIGTDQFTYTLRQVGSNVYSDPVTVTLEVIAPGGELPIGIADNYGTEEGQTLTIAAPGLMVNDFHPDGAGFLVSTFTQTTHGTLTSVVTSGAFVYVPDAGFTGTDQFTYTLRELGTNIFSAPVTVTIEVFADFNRKPVGIPDEYGTSAETPLVIAAPGLGANDLDPDGDDFLVSTFTQTTHGTLTSIVTSGAFSYVPDAGFTGTDQFTYTLREVGSNVFSDPVTVTIRVFEKFNRNPVGISDHYGTPEGIPLTVVAPGLRINDFDPDGDDFVVSTFTQTTHGTLTSIVTSGAFTYVPDAGFSGTDQFTYMLRDAEGNFSDPVTVTLEVIDTNQPPVASAADVTTECQGPSGTVVTLDGSLTTDPDGDELQYTWYENGLVIAGPSTSPFAEVQLETGVHTITLTVEDECGSTSSDDAAVTVEDTSAPIVEAAFLNSDKPNEFEISCSSEDVCTEISSSVSVIRIPGLNNPAVSLKNNKNYALEIDLKKNTVSVKAPDAGAFWAMILANGGVEVSDGQVIKAKYDKNKYKYDFDTQGNLVSVGGEVVTLRCTATDGNGNTGEDKATLPADLMQSLAGEPETAAGKLKSGTAEPSGINVGEPDVLHRNYPNPFAQTTLIEYELEAPAFVTVSVIDNAGRLVQELSAGQMPAGVQQVTWDATGRKPGIYFYRIAYNNRHLTGKMLLR